MTSNGSFYDWLAQQAQRSDSVGIFSRYALKDIFFPRRARHLHIFLLRYEGLPEQREGVKKAHAEWRREMKLHRSKGVAA